MSKDYEVAQLASGHNWTDRDRTVTVSQTVSGEAVVNPQVPTVPSTPTTGGGLTAEQILELLEGQLTPTQFTPSLAATLATISNPVIDPTPPPTPTGFTAYPGFSEILLRCDVQTYTQGRGHGRSLVYGVVWPDATPQPDFTAAVQLSFFTGNVSTVPALSTTRYCLWLKWESKDGILSILPSDVVVVTTGEDIAALLAAITSSISYSALDAALKARIDLIDSAASVAGSVNQRIADEAASRAAALSALSAIKNRHFYSSTAPISDITYTLVVDDLWTRDPDNRQFRWNGSAWVDITDVRLSSSTASVTQEAQQRADADAAEAAARLSLYAALKSAATAYKVFSQLSSPTVAATDIGAVWTWTDTSGNNFFRRYTGSAWVDSLGDTRPAKYQGAFATGSLPTVGVVIGDLARDTTTGTIKVWNGSAWVTNANTDPIYAYYDQEQSARVAADAAEASQRVTLATQLTGGYGGTDPNALSSGLVYQEKTARASGDSANTALITSLQSSLDNGSRTPWEPWQTWNFPHVSEGWTVVNGSLVVGNALSTDFLTVSANVANDPQLLSPVVSIPGDYYKVRVRLRRVAGTGWDGTLYYATELHGISNSYKKTISVPVFPSNSGSVSDWVIIEWNMYPVDLTDTDWITNKIIQIRLDFGSASDDVFDVDWISVGRPGTPVSTASFLQEVDTRTTADSAEVTARQLLSSTVLGTTNPASVSLGTLTSGLLYDEKTARVSAIGSVVSDVSALELRVDRITNYYIQSKGVDNILHGPIGGGASGVYSEDGSVIQTGVLSYNILVIDRVNGSIYGQTYDVYNNGAGTSGRNAHTLADDLNALSPDKIVVVYSAQDPSTNLTTELKTALKRCGATSVILDNIQYRSAYVLVGIPGQGEGTGIERYMGTATDPTIAWVDYNLQIVNGNPTGIASNPQAPVLSAKIQEEKSIRLSETGALFAQWTVKLDAGGKISGIGLASSSANSWTSEVAVRSDRFSITAPEANDGQGISGVVPFYVQTSNLTLNGVAVPKGVYIDAAYINNVNALWGRFGTLIADSIHATELDAARFTLGDGTIGGRLKSSNYVLNVSGWILNPDGTAQFPAAYIIGQLTAAQINSNGLSIRNNAGAVVLNAAAGTFLGDVTGTVQGTAAAAVALAVSNFNLSNDQNGAAIANPTVASDGTAVDHVQHNDGSVDVSFEWSWAGTEADIDGFMIYIRQSGDPAAYTFGTTPAEESVEVVPANKRAFILMGSPADKYYTFGVRAYRRVDTNVSASGIILSSLVKAQGTGENPYQPMLYVGFLGDVLGTIQGTSSLTVRNGAADGTIARAAINDATTGLAARLRNNAQNVLAGAGGLAAGTLTWDSSGTRTGGYGVGFTQNGIAAYNNLGQTTFSLNAATGDAVFAGTLSAASGTFNTMQIVVGGNLRSGQTAWNNGVGSWRGWDNGTYKESFGNSSGARVVWDGSNLVITGANVNAPIMDPFSASIPDGDIIDLTEDVDPGYVIYGTRTVSVTGGRAPYKYTWTLQDDGHVYRAMGLIAGTTTATVSIAGSADGNVNSGILMCFVTDANGRVTLASCSVQVLHRPSGGGGDTGGPD